MTFNFSFSSSATVVSTSSVNGRAQGWAYTRDAYSTNDGSGVRTTSQNLGDPPVIRTTTFDAQGRPLLIEHSGRTSQPQSQQAGVPGRRIITIEDVTEGDNKIAQESSRQ